MIIFSSLFSVFLSKSAKMKQFSVDSVKTILKDNYPTFVKALGENIKDPKFRAAIRSLAAVSHVNYTNIAAQVSNLIPTQNEVDVDKSLKYPLTNVDSVKTALYCQEPIKIMNSSIVTSGGGKFVIDGHHRWSQIYAINPNCTMAALDLSDIKDPLNALKSTQLGIAAGTTANGTEITEIPIAIVEGRNLLNITESDLKAYVQGKITPEVLAAFTEYSAQLNSNEKVADYIWNNVQRMQTYNQPIPGAPSRGMMPQTDLSTDWVKNTVNPSVINPLSFLDSSKLSLGSFFIMLIVAILI